MQACGNDYIYIDCFDKRVENPSRLAKKLSQRRFSIGGDGLVLICPSKRANAKMIMYNADGSLGKTCGNALRSIAKYLYLSGRIDSPRGVIQTSSGDRRFYLDIKGGKVVSVAVQMGKASFENVFDCQKSSAVNAPFCVLGKKLYLTCLSVGNPHAVCFVKDLSKTDVGALGAAINGSPYFSGGVNVEFVEVLSKRKMRVRVYERGSGITYACGSGACAVAAAAAKLKIVAFNEPIALLFDGGTLTVTVKSDYFLTLSGDAQIVFRGEIDA